MKKPGLLKRIFSFGRKKQQEPEDSIQAETGVHKVEPAAENQIVDPVVDAPVEFQDKPIESPDPVKPQEIEVTPVATDDSAAEALELDDYPETSVEDSIEIGAEEPAAREPEPHDAKSDAEIIDSLPKSPEDYKRSEVVAATQDKVRAEIIIVEQAEPSKATIEEPVDDEVAGPVAVVPENTEGKGLSELPLDELPLDEVREVHEEPEDLGDPVAEPSSKHDDLPEQPDSPAVDSDDDVSDQRSEVPESPAPKEEVSAKDTHIRSKASTSAVVETEVEPEEKKSWFKRLSQGLSRSSAQLTENIAAVFTKKKLDDAALEDLEDILLQADLGIETANNIVDSLAKQRMGKDVSDEEVRSIMAEEIEKVLSPVAMPLELDLDHKPHVILVVGVNGSGKTTTIGKLTRKLGDGGYSTMLVAGDTFRAAAVEQLQIWGERTGAPVIARPLGSDSSGLAYDAMQTAKEQGSDVLMMDTAGRLQNKTELMAELEKIIRVMRKLDPSAPHTVLLTLDATTGQNALNQVEIFRKVAEVNGLVMTKLDGSARGGILVAISAKYNLPVYFVGVGEQVEDLEPFEAQEFARTIAGLNA